MGSREFPLEQNEMCDSCGRKGAFDIYGDHLCASCMTTGDPEEDREYMKEEVAFLTDENLKLNRLLKRKENKIKHLKQQVSENKLRRRLEQQGERMREMGEVIERLKREKVALHEYVEAQNTEEES